MAQGMQHRSRSTSTSVANCAVHGCSYSQRKLNNIYGMHCFDCILLLRMECTCGHPP